MTTTLFLDLAICIFLVIGLTLAFVINKRLAALYKGRSEFQGLIDAFTDAIDRGQKSVAHIEELDNTIGKRLEASMEKGSDLLEDLRFFINRGEAMMNKLEEDIRKVRTIKQELQTFAQAFSENTERPTEEERAQEPIEPVMETNIRPLNPQRSSIDTDDTPLNFLRMFASKRDARR